MKIGLNATCLNDRPSGARQRFVGIYGELIKRLPDAEFIVYEPVDCRVSNWFDGSANVTARHTSIPSEGRAKKFIHGLKYWRTALQDENFDYFERFNLPIVKAPSGQTIQTIHDIRGIYPENGTITSAAYKMYIGKSLRAADHVIAVSETMKEEILGFFPEIPITVIYNGFNAAEFDTVSEKSTQEFCLKYSLPEEFILAVGHFEKRKNYLRLVDAIERLRDRGHSCSLLIIGNDSGERKLVEERVAAANLSNHVQILCGLNDLEVRCAYKLSSMLVFPSSYEGFGIPILEAMAASRPMVLSNMPVFREITQDQGVYFPHDDVELMAHAIEKVLSSSSERSRLVAYGNVRVHEFSFHNLAAQVEQLYKALI